MLRLLEIISSSFKMALQELWKNKLRTFLSLFGVTIGIFCIIGVLAAVNSLQENIQSTVKTLGTNTVYIDKWQWGNNGSGLPYWKMAKRPSPKFEELKFIREKTPSVQYAAFKIQTTSTVEVGDNRLSNVNIYGVTDEFSTIRPIEIAYGRFFTDAEFAVGSNHAVIGDEVATQLFILPERALNKLVTVSGKTLVVVGIIKKQGKQIIGGWGFDQSLITPYQYARTFMNELYASPLLMCQAYGNINSRALKDDLRGSIRSVRKLSPSQEDNFSLNDVNDISAALETAFSSINIGGWIIGALAFIVGIFGVANIMFVTVKERTSQIGLKKAIGAKNHLILTEFLLESAFLCIIGGLIGLLLVFIMAKIATALISFPFFLSINIILVALIICILAGILAGIVPAIRASKLNPVVAIRST